MIITNIKGGLGNQMFQYAAGRSLALLHGVPLKLDLSAFAEHVPGDTIRYYALNAFELRAEPATPARFTWRWMLTACPLSLR